jgi:glutamyl-tRNA reductase
MTVLAPIAGRHDQGVKAAGPTVVALVLHARAVPSLTRETFMKAAAEACAAHLAAGGSGAFLVHTCHRVELYLAPHAGEGPAIPPLPAGTERLEDVEAVRHLIEVASGLDAAVFGEDQILHQLRVALAERRTAGALEPVLDRLFQSALRAGRQAHAWFDRSPRSLADVALDRIAARVGPVEGRSILVAGCGRMGRLAAFAAHRRGARVVVVNRTDERARALAADVGGHAVPFGVDDVLPSLDGAVVALAGPWTLGARDEDRVAAAGVPVVDLSSPPSVSPAMQARLGAQFTSVDDLVVGPEFAPHDRLRRRIEKVVADAGRDYCLWLRNRESVPLIQAVSASAEQIREAELEWLVRRLPGLGPDEQATIEQMSHRLVAALLHAPLDALHADEAGALERAARDLFGL